MRSSSPPLHSPFIPGSSSFAIILNQDASLYCLLVPSAGFLGLLVLAAEDLAVRLGGKKLRAATVALLLAWYGVTFTWMALPGHAVGRHVQACRRVAESHARLRESLPQEVTGPFGFLLEGGDSRMRWLFFDSSERSVMNFVLQRPGDFAHFLASPESDRIPSGAYTFLYDRAFNLRDIRQGERILFQAPARPVLN